MTDEEYARFVKTWDWAEFGAPSAALRAEGTEAGELGARELAAPTGATGAGTQDSPAAPKTRAGDVGQGDLLPSKAVTAEEASAPPAPTQASPGSAAEGRGRAQGRAIRPGLPATPSGAGDGVLKAAPARPAPQQGALL